MFTPDLTIAAFDPELASAMEHERQRQEDHIELIASENYASPCVLEAQGSVLTNKYAEGYPGRRYYGGCQYVDVAEKLIERVRWWDWYTGIYNVRFDSNPSVGNKAGGLTTIVFPATSDGPNLRPARATGKFQAVRATVTPYGTR